MTRMTFLSDSVASFWSLSATHINPTREMTHQHLLFAPHEALKPLKNPHKHSADNTALGKPYHVLQEDLAQQSSSSQSSLAHACRIALEDLRFKQFIHDREQDTVKNRRQGLFRREQLWGREQSLQVRDRSLSYRLMDIDALLGNG